MSYLVDTDVLSQYSKPSPHEGAMAWMRSISETQIYLSVITLSELRTGIDLMPRGRKRDDLEVWLGEMKDRFRNQILPFDERSADIAGRLIASSKLKGDNLELTDIFIAATAKSHGLQIATLNRKHFARLGVDLVEF